MGMIGNMIADAASIAQRYQKRLMPDIAESQFGQLARVEGKTITSNHPAFVLGHLSLYPAKTLALLGRPLGRAQLPESYERLFSKDASCVDDPNQSIYPSKGELIAFFEASYSEALQAIRAGSDEFYSGENPSEGAIKTACPTLGSMIAFYMDGHVMMHLGQISAWRRMQGLPAV